METKKRVHKCTISEELVKIWQENITANDIKVLINEYYGKFSAYKIRNAINTGYIRDEDLELAEIITNHINEKKERFKKDNERLLNSLK